MIVKREIVINAGLEACWSVLGKDFANAHKWASAIKHSRGSGDSFNGAACSIRGCELKGMGSLKEKLLEYSDDKHALKYEVVEGLPDMITKGTNSWSLIPVEQHKTRLIMEMDLTLGSFLGKIMQPIMKIQMGNMGTRFLEEFKYYLEKGTPHPRKIKSLS